MSVKNLYGNIEINSKGDFIRTIDFGGSKKKEGIYSPITQNQRHVELMKKIRIDHNKNFITKLIAERYFESIYKSIVVLSNPKTVVNDRYAKKEVKDNVIRVDQLVKYIKDMNASSKEVSQSDEDLLAWGNTYLKFHKEVEKDYTSKYDKYKIQDEKSEEDTINRTSAIIKDIPVEETEIFKALKAFRLAKSREENIKPYFIFNDNQLKDLISKMPTTTSELLTVSGIGEVKVKKYGEEIINIVKVYK